MMKQVALLFVSLFFDMSSMTRTVQSHGLKNMASYFTESPRTFGTTHFIVGYKENPYSKQSKNKSTITSKHAVLESATQNTCIDRNCVVQSFFTTVRDLSPIVLSMIEETEKTLYLAAFNF